MEDLPTTNLRSTRRAHVEHLYPSRLPHLLQHFRNTSYLCKEHQLSSKRIMITTFVEEANPEDRTDKKEYDTDRHELSRTSRATKITDVKERSLKITGVDF